MLCYCMGPGDRFIYYFTGAWWQVYAMLLGPGDRFICYVIGAWWQVHMLCYWGLVTGSYAKLLGPGDRFICYVIEGLVTGSYSMLLGAWWQVHILCYWGPAGQQFWHNGSYSSYSKPGDQFTFCSDWGLLVCYLGPAVQNHSGAYCLIIQLMHLYSYVYIAYRPIHI